MSYTMLQVASFGLGVLNQSNTWKRDTRNYYNSLETAHRQAAINRGLAYNSYLNLNEQQMLQAKKRAFDVSLLYRQIRAAKASERAAIESLGGDTQTGSGAARIRNIERQGAEALARKDLNFQTTLNDFKVRRKNIGLETLNKNNKAFSGLTALPDATGLVAPIIGLGIEKYTDIGYYKAADGTMKARGFS